MLIGRNCKAIPEELTIIPGLPRDLARLCLACVPFSEYGRLKVVCKAWRATLYTKFLFDLRKKWGKSEEFLCLFRDDPSVGQGEIFDPRSESWSLILSMPCDPYRYGLTNFVCVAIEGHLYVIGGSLFDTRSFPMHRPSSSSAVFRYDPVRSRWERHSRMNNARGSFACGVCNDNGVVVAGGGSRHAQFSAGGSRLSFVERYDVQKDRWFKEEDLPSVRAGCVGFVLHDEFWVMGGYGNSRTVGGVFPIDEYYRDGEILCTGSGKWRELQPMWEEGERWRLGRVALMEGKNGEPLGIFMLEGFKIYRTVITGSMRVPSLPGVPSTYDSATVAVNADGFIARDIAFENAAEPGSHQAVALRVDSDLSTFYNCAFLGHQDTLYTHTLRQFYRNCRIEGTVDFIFGNSAAIFENCLILVRPRQLKSSKGSSDPVTAQGRIDPGQPTGFVFHNCTINGTEEYMKNFYTHPKIYKAYLGRPWKMFSRVIFMNSYLEELISPKGWMPWRGDFALDTLYYGEYQNYGPGAKVSGRVRWSNQIPENNAGMYSIESFIQGDEWLPATIS